MSAGVSYRSTRRERESDHPQRPSSAHVVLAATIGAFGPVAAIRGWGPVTLEDGTRPVAMVTVAAVAVMTSSLLCRVRGRSRLAALPVLVLLGSSATWPTIGRIQGAWCVLATASAVVIVSTLEQPTRSRTRTLLTSAALALATYSGALWAWSGPGAGGVATLGVATLTGTTLARNGLLDEAGDLLLDRAAQRMRTVLSTGRRSLRRVCSRASMVPGSARLHSEVLAGLATTAVMFPAFLPLVSDTTRTSIGFTDYQLHMAAAATTSLMPFTTMTPHWLFQVMTALFRPILGLHAAAALVLAGSCGVAVAVLSRRAGREGGAPTPIIAALIGTVAFWLESPTAVLNAIGWLSPPLPFAPFHAWGSPTDTLAFPLLLILVIAVARLVDEPDAPWFRPTAPRVALAVAVTATLLAKPNIPMVMLGVVPLAILLRHGWRLQRLAAAALWLVLPTMVVLVLQYRHMHVGRAISEYDPGGWGVTVDPFAFLRLWPAGEGGAWFWLSMPVVCVLGAWVLGRRIWTDPVLKVAGLTLLVSFVPMVMLRETGLHANDGNFMKAAYGASMVLTALITAEIGRELWRQRPPSGSWSTGHRRRRVAASIAVAGLFLLGGAAVYVTTVAPELAPGSIWPGADPLRTAAPG